MDNNVKKNVVKALVVITTILLIIGCYILMGWLFSSLWNFALVPVLDVNTMNIWQGMAVMWILSIISKILRVSKKID